MNICITPDSVKLFASYFKKQIPSQFTNEITATALLNKLFDEALSNFKSTGLSQARNKELILQHLSIVPQVVKQYMGETPSANNPGLLASMNDLSQKVYAASQSDSPTEFQNVINELGRILGSVKVIAPVADERFDAVSFEMFKTVNQEVIYEEGVGYKNNITDPEKEFEFDVQRNIILNGNKDGLQFKVVTQGSLESVEGINNTLNNADPDLFVLVPITSDGELARFDEKGVLSSEGKTPVYAFKQNRSEFDYLAKAKTGFYIAQGMTAEQAEQKVNSEIKGYLDVVSDLIKKYNEGQIAKVDINLNASLLGFVESNIHNKTPLSQISNVDALNLSIEQTEKNWYPVIYAPVSGKATGVSEKNELFENSLADITDEELNTLTELITNFDLKVAGYKDKIRPDKRKSLIYYFHQKSSNFEYQIKTVRNDKTGKFSYEYYMKIGNSILEINNQNKELIKQTLKDYFTTKTSKPYLYSTKFTNLKPFASIEETTDINQVFLKPDGTYGVTTGPKRNMNIERSTDLSAEFDFPMSVKDGVIALGKKTHKQHIIENTKTSFVPNANMEIRGFGSYLALSPTLESISNVETPGDREVLFRSIAEQNLASKPTAAQNKKAEEWTKTNPLVKLLSVNFKNELHEKGPSFVAEYVKGAVNLYLGSNNTDVYHEAFHAFTQAILTKEERDQMYNELRKTPGNFSVVVNGAKKTVAFNTATDLEIEEYLAEKFREFAISKGKLSNKLSTRVGQFFEKLWNLLQGMFGKNMTYNEAIALNKSNNVVNAMFNALYEGNIDTSKFNPQASQELFFRSNALSIPNTQFSLEEIQLTMESINSLMSEFINYGINASTDRATNLEVVKLLLEASTIKVDSERYNQINEQINTLNSTSGTINGYGVFAVASNPRVLNFALEFIQNRLTQQRDLLAPKKGEEPSFGYKTLTKVLENFGSKDDAFDYIGADIHENILSLYLNAYSTINVSNPEVDITDEMNDEERFQFLFNLSGTERSLSELTDAQTKQLLSSIHAHSNNGKGPIMVNSLGIKKLQPFAQMLAKTSKLLRNTTDRVEMYNKLKKAAQTDYELKQILLKLGDLNNPNISVEEQKQWLAFWQVMNKSDLLLREFILEKNVDKESKAVTFEARSGRSKSQAQRIGSDWGDNFVFVSQTNENYGYDAERGTHYLLPTDLALKFAEKGFGLVSGTGPSFIKNKNEALPGSKYTRETYRAVAEPFEFLRNLGIDLVEDEVIADILRNGSTALDIQPGIINNILESMLKRELAVKESDKVVYTLKDLFKEFSYREEGSTETKKQEGLAGWFTQLQNLQFMFSDADSSFMGINASGDKQSEKSLNSSLTVMINTLNNVSSYDELLRTPGMEMFDVDNNPFAAASPWLVDMFNLESTDVTLRGKKVSNFKITAENLSGSKIIFDIEDKGISAIASDEKTKFISDFHLTLEGKQEILRSEAKSTSLTVHAPVKKNGVLSKTDLVFNKADIEKVYTDAYDKNEKSTILYNQFYRHLEAELIRITRLNAIAEAVERGEDVEFDAAYLDRGRSFYMFDGILDLDSSLKSKLLALKLDESFTLNNILDAKTKKKIDLALKKYFASKSESLFNEKNSELTIADNVFANYANTNESVEETRKKMFKVFTLNNFIQNANYATLFIGDAALYKVEAEDYHKRIAGLISTGNIFAVDSAFLSFVNNPKFNNFGFAKKHNGAEYKRDYNGYLNTAVIKEKETSSAYLQQLKDIIKIDAESYGDGELMKEADGAGWISFDAYRLMNLSCNEWSDAQEALYQKMLSGEKIKQEDIKSTFPVRKFQHYGPVTNDNAKQYGLQMMAFHKYSLMPLIPALIENTPLKKLHDQMMEQGIDYVTMQSGSKVSSISKVELKSDGKFVGAFDNVYDENRNINQIAFTVNRVSSKYLKNQIFIAAGYKKKITLPTQKRKMIVLGLMDNAAPTDFLPNENDAVRETKWNAITSEAKKRQASKNYDWYKRYEIVISKIQAHLKNELLEDIGLKFEKGRYVGDSSKLVNYLQAQMKNNDLLPEDIEFITTPDGKLKTDLSLSMYSEKIESILTTLADKKLRSLKVTGEALVQVPGTMFENSERADAFARLKEPTAADIYNYGSNGLKFYHVVDENGEPVLTENKSWIVKAMEVKISLQGDFKKLLYLDHFDGKQIAVYTENENGKKELDVEASRLRLNEAIRNENWNKANKKFLEIAGDRIPAQGPNALESITVAEFLPEWAGPIVILPAEIVAKAGSDYDIDKLFAQFPNIVRIGKKVELQKYLPNVTESLEELGEQRDAYRKAVSEAQDELNSLYEDRQLFWMQSNEIADSIKQQIQKEQGLEKDLYETRNELNGYLNAAEKGIWKFKNLSLDARTPYIDQYREQLDAVNNLIEIQNQAIKDTMYRELGAELASDFFNYNKSKIDEVQERLDRNANLLEDIQRKIYGKSIKGLQNELLELFAERILLPGNIKDLVTANSTKTALPISQKIAERLNASKKANKFSKYDRASGKQESKISKSTIFDYRYNLLKHQENSVGLDSLGIAAVTATFYAVFTTFGAKLNAVSASEQEAFDKALATFNDEKASSKDKDKAADIINKFKSHTFTLNHNSVIGEYGKQIGLGFINNTKGQSIADLLSQLINGYVDVAKDAWIFNIQGNKQNTPTLLFMVMAGVDLESAAYLASSPLVMEYNQIKKELDGVYSSLSTDPDVNPVVPTTKINQKAQEQIFENHKALFEANGYQVAAFNAIFNKNTEPFTESELLNMIGNEPGFREIQALAEYIQIEKMANDVSKFQQLSRFDTNKVASISEAQKRTDDIETYQGRKKYVPNEWFGEKGIKNSPIGQFNNDKFIVDLFERYFSFRNNPAVVKASLKLENVKGIIPEVMRNDFKNDFLFFLYQNSLYQDNKYDGYELSLAADPNAPMTIDEETKTITYGANLYSNDIQNPAMGMSNIGSNFATPNQFLRYKIEFEKLNGQEMSDLREQYYYLDNPKKPVSDLYLKQKIALYKSRNHIAYFSGPTSVANVFKNFRLKYPELAKEFSLINDMRFDYDAKNLKSNMYLPDISDPDMSAKYKENLRALQNHSAPEVREFFNMFDHIAMMQTGLNRRSKYDLGKIITADHLESVIQNGIGVARVENELNQVLENILEAEANNKDKSKPKVEPDLQLLGQFFSMFENMVNTKYKIRTKGYNYEVQKLNWGKSKEKSETILAFNNVDIRSNLNNLPKGTVGITADLFFDEDGEYTPEEFAAELEGKKIAILNERMIVPAGENQKKFDALLKDKFGIDNTGEFPTLEYKSKFKKEGYLSIAGLGTELKAIHSVKDEAMANASTVAIGKATILNPKYKSSTQMYVDELTRVEPSKLATSRTKFKSTDSVWIFGSGVFANAYRNSTIEEFQKALDETFEKYHKPLIQKAITAGVKTFNVGTASGIDQKAVDFLEENGFVKVPMYAAVGKYYEMRKPNADFADLNYDISAPVVTSNDLNAADLISYFFDSNTKDNWFNDLSESNLFESGVSIVYDKIVKELNRNQQYKIKFANAVARSTGRISIGNSLLAGYIEQALYKMKNDILEHRKSTTKAPIIVSQINTAGLENPKSEQLYSEYKGTLSKDMFLSLSLEEQIEIIEQQKNC